MALEKYRKMRDFGQTPEPAGAQPEPSERGIFVIQKHDATRLHWDVRLELDGVLPSWAVPKGPSLDPAEKRLAVRTEDHPLEYAQFEGNIPKGHYGAGDMIIWDRGHWAPIGDPHVGLKKGHLHFRLDGERLHGEWHLVRLPGRGDANRGKENWLLMKVEDAFAVPGSGALVVEQYPGSVMSGKTTRKRQLKRDTTERPPPTVDVASIPGAKPAKSPDRIQPQLATLADKVPAGDEWLHEMKLDGYRILVHVKGGAVEAMTRSGKDWTDRMQVLVPEARALAVTEAVLDGELVVYAEDGRTSFQALQNALSGRGDELVYQVFDLLYLDGHDLRDVPLEKRKLALAALVTGENTGRIRYTDHVVGAGDLFFAEACRVGLEGIVCKRRDGRYVGARSTSWLKVKCLERQELVIGGFTPPKGTREAFGALLVGVYEGDSLRYAGKVGTGFTDKTLKELYGRLKKLEVAEPPFADPPRGAPVRGAKWVKPQLVAEVAFAEWTHDGVLRHPSFQGLREDKPARQVIREASVKVGRAEATRKPSKAKAKAAVAPPKPERVRGKNGRVDVSDVSLSNPDKVLYPDVGITKLQLAEYYETVGEEMLRHAGRRPLTLVRCPEGTEGQCFFQKHMKPGMHKAVMPLEIADSGGTDIYLEVDSVTGLVSLLQMGALEFHVWGSHSDKLEHPDRIVFDLDPDPSVGWERVVEGAFDVKARLEKLGLQSFPLMTGGKGLHVVVPVQRKLDWDETKAFTLAFAERMVKDAPTKYTSVLSKAKRKGRIFVDYLRNGRGATAIAPWSTRARAGCTIAVPLTWDEADLKPGSFSIGDAPARLALDPWPDYFTVKQNITAAARKAV